MGDHYRFFVDPGCIDGETATVTGACAHQIMRVMRLKEGDRLCLLDGLGNEHEARVASLSKTGVKVNITGASRCLGEPGVRLTLAVCHPKGDKLDLIVQKSAELGISGIVVVKSERSVSRPEPGKIAGRIERWRKIAAEAAEQSGRGTIPDVRWIDGFEELAPLIGDHSLSILAWEDESGTTIRDVLRARRGVDSALFVVGPEGGLTQREVDTATEAGAVRVTLGKRVLRCETAAIAGCAAIMYELEGEL